MLARRRDAGPADLFLQAENLSGLASDRGFKVTGSECVVSDRGVNIEGVSTLGFKVGGGRTSFLTPLLWL